MFDNLKNLAGLPGLMSKAREAQDKMRAVQEDLARQQFTADVADGRVTATVSGKLELVRLRIDKERTNLDDVTMLEDLTVAAVAAAQRKAMEGMQDAMAKAMGDLGLPPGMLPGM